MDCQELLNVIYICFAIYRTGSISPFIIMRIATICWTCNYMTNTLPMLFYLIFTTALWGIFIPFSLMPNWDTERSSDLAKIKQLVIHRARIFILDLSDSKVHALSSVTHGSVLSKRLSSWYKHSKCTVPKRLASF